MRGYSKTTCKAETMIADSFELLTALRAAGFLRTHRDDRWWPHSGSFEVVVSAVLTQQSRWEKVEISLENLRTAGLLDTKALAEAQVRDVAEAIRPSGFYNTKAERLVRLCREIDEDFGDFDRFCEHVDRTWLLARKGIGPESADSILCYACLRPAMVVDSYTARLLEALGFCFESYDEIQTWLCEGLDAHRDALEKIYGAPLDMSLVYARLHGKIVEYAKAYIRGRRVDTTPLGVIPHTI